MRSFFGWLGSTVDLALIIAGAITIIHQFASMSMTAGATTLAVTAIYFAIRLRNTR